VAETYISPRQSLYRAGEQQADMRDWWALGRLALLGCCVEQAGEAAFSIDTDEIGCCGLLEGQHRRDRCGGVEGTSLAQGA
jgi:hypothetical protein